jgi:hypothetical protein
MGGGYLPLQPLAGRALHRYSLCKRPFDDIVEPPEQSEFTGKQRDMAAASIHSAEVDAQRAELRAVLAAPEFARAPRLAHLLTYLCEKLFAGEAAQIKEYSVGVEVFERGESFDQDSDSIVRVEANRLRKRLAEYYAGEGAGHALQITIPVGQYVPRFSPVAREANDGSQLTASAANLPSPTDLPGKGRANAMQRAFRRPWGLVAAVVVCLAVAYAWRVSLKRAETSASKEAAQPVYSNGFQFGPPSGPEIRILAGANRSLGDHAGKLWNSDTWFTGGTAVKSDALHIWRTQDQGFYRTSRQGQSFRYDIPLKQGVYELRLHFAETVYDPESTGTGAEGKRLMTVRANGKTLLSGFDVVADAGGSNTADVKIFPDIAPAADGYLHLEFSGDNGEPAIVSAIEILPGLRGHALPIRILPRQTPYYSDDSRWWSPDEYFQGGRIASYTTPVTGTDDPELFETERWGNFTYAIPVPPGKYSLTLYFAARRVDPDQFPLPAGEAKSAAARVFNVFSNGRPLLENFDLAREAREKDVIIRKFTDLEPNAQGKLFISFVPVDGYATVSGIEVLAE